MKLSMESLLAKIGADNDQELEEAREWMRTESLENILRVWMTIQRTHADPAVEIMSMLAQLKMGELIAESDRFKSATRSST